MVKRHTFIVVNRAFIHTTDFIYDRLEEWKKRGLYIFEIPTYSPEFNLIEIL
ncbi:transposase [Microcoleus sp. LEGE 07076]|uniref:transposase n=1 Tax=Microcoleus sp. LEGE 07076 TaxID=915322 RepID=UPI0034CE4E9E